MSTTEQQLQEPGKSAPLDKSVMQGTASIPPDTANDKQKSFSAVIPEEYKHKEHYQNMLKTDDPFTEMFKSYESAQAMIGQRAGLQVPTAESTPEQVKEWRKATGVPDEIGEAYKPKPIEWADDDKDFAKVVTENRVGDVLTKLGAKAHELGVTPAQFQAIVETYDKEMVAGLKTTMGEQVKVMVERDKDFTTRINKMYGDKTQSVLDAGKALLQANVPAEVLQELQNAPPAALQALTIALANVGKKYIREDNFNSQGGLGGAANAYTSGKEVSEAANKLRNQTDAKGEVIWLNPRHPEHKALVAKVNKMYEDNRALLSKG